MNSKFIDSSLLIYQTFLQLRDQYPNHLFSTANDLRNDNHYPNPLPQLYFYKPLEEDNRQEYMLDIFTDTLFFYIKKRIDQYIAHYEDGDWLRKQYPTIVLVVPDSRLQEKATKYFENAKDNAFIEDEDLIFLAVTSGH